MRHGDSSVVGISSPSHRHQTLRIFDLSPWTDICLQKPDTIFQIGITVHRSSRGGRDTIDHSISIILDTSVVGFLGLFCDLPVHPRPRGGFTIKMYLFVITSEIRDRPPDAMYDSKAISKTALD